jgi:two-component sensor histidine kinase/CHASE1-domain containing sensor protein
MSGHAIPSRPKLVAALIGVAVLCWFAGKLGVLIMPRGYPPAVGVTAGVAIVAIMLGGYRFALSLAVGTFLFHFLESRAAGYGHATSALVGAGIAAGAALQACAGVWLVRRIVAPAPSLDEARDVGLFLILAGPIACVINATVATATLLMAGEVPPGDLGLHWATWWAADTTGTLLLAPLLLVWFARPAPERGRRQWITVPVVLAVALVVVLAVRVNRGEQSRLDASLRQRADQVTAALERGSDHYLHVVQSIADFDHAVGRVEGDAFEQFVKGALADPGIRALGWAPRLSDSERADYEVNRREEGRAGYELLEPDDHGQLVRANDRPDYYPLDLIEPRQSHARLLGLDLASTARWRTALEASAQSGQPLATVDTGLLGRGRPVLVILVPVFFGNPSDGPHRPEGFAVGICSLSALVGTALRVGAHEGLDVALYERTDGGSQLAYATATVEPAPSRRGQAIATTPRIAGRPWGLQIYASGEYLAAERGWQAWLVLAAGVLFVAWLEAFLLLMAGRTSKIEQVVAQRTRELEVSNREVEEQRAELSRSNTDLSAALNAQEILLRELHHRVKNNLQVIASLFSLQARYLPDPRYREIFEESRNRVFSIALAHEKLYRSKDLNRIDFSEYARNLVSHLHSMLGPNSAINVVTEISEMTLPVETAIPCGLVINELVTNAFKHAFPAGRHGAIRVVLREVDPARWLVAVEDDGIGLPAQISLGKTDSLGLDLVSILATQIGAEVEVNRERGTSFRLTFGGGKRRADAA